MRHLFEIFGQTLKTLWAHKLRSFLTMFGIAWGVGSLLLLVGLGEGFRSGNKKQFDELGENVMFIWGGRAPAMSGSFTSMKQYYLTMKDYADILAGCPHVKDAVPVIQRSDIRAVSDFFQSSGQVLGTLPKFNQIRYLPVDEGRWFNELDNADKRRVIVLGAETKRLLFPGRPAIGSTILLNGVDFQVIGVAKRLGHGDNNNQNLKSFVPLSVMHENFPPLNVGGITDAISFIDYQPLTRESA
jgi:putative ABC transport system permease protein